MGLHRYGYNIKHHKKRLYKTWRLITGRPSHRHGSRTTGRADYLPAEIVVMGEYPRHVVRPASVILT